jgi:tryptophanyl-tRNA synthetase
VEHFAPLRERRQRFVDDPKLVDDIVATGCQRARDAAVATMDAVRTAMELG